ncbi:unnamed protein product, partial [Dibothriocephalus latus]
MTIKPIRPLNIDGLVDAASTPVHQSPISEEPVRPKKVPRQAYRPSIPSPSPKLQPVDFTFRMPIRAISVPPSPGSYRTEYRRELRSPRTQSPSMSPPVFIQPLHNAAATQGQMVKLQCQITWFKDGQRIFTGANRTIGSEQNQHTLVFSDIFMEDTGEYTCFATNPVGTAHTSCRMDVEPLSSGDEALDMAPQLVKPLPSDLQITEGDGVVFECRFLGRPEPTITWLKDDTVLQPSPHHQLTTTLTQLLPPPSPLKSTSSLQILTRRSVTPVPPLPESPAEHCFASSPPITRSYSFGQAEARPLPTHRVEL